MKKPKASRLGTLTERLTKAAIELDAIMDELELANLKTQAKHLDVAGEHICGALEDLEYLEDSAAA